MTEQENLRRLNEWRVKENLPTIALAQAVTVTGGKATTALPTAISPGKTLPTNGDNTVDLAGDGDDVDDDDDAEEDEDEEDEEDDDGDVDLDSEDVEIDLNE